MRFNTNIVVEALTALGIPAIARGNVIEISTGLVGIDEACSGIRSLQATLMISLFFGELYRLTMARRTALVLAGAGLAFGCNMVRTFVLVWVCSISGLGALDRWHDPTGIGILLACFTGLWLVSLKLRHATETKAITPMPADLSPHPAASLLRFVPLGLIVWLVVVEVGTEASLP